MARKSRKIQSTQTTQASTVLADPTFKTALYLRLSVLDSGRKDGDAIINQQTFLERYISDRPEFTLKEIFVDNGATGVDFERPAWNHLMRECRLGNINCIIIKDLSRLGRNYIETGDYLERILPSMGVRLIAVSDSYDSMNLTNSERLISGLKNLVNDIYAKDISRKSSAALRVKQKQGQYIGSFAPYGYIKDKSDKNKILINPETAPIVRQIFKLKAEGVGTNRICQTLIEQDIPSPGRYGYINGFWQSDKYKDSLWNHKTVANILRNPFYFGHMVQGRFNAALYEGRPKGIAKQENWLIVENTHEPIISQELFDAVAAVMDERKASYDAVSGKYEHLGKTDNSLNGLVYCADCKKSPYAAQDGL